MIASLALKTFPPRPYALQVSGMNCIGPRAPAELGERTRPNADSTKLTAARTCHPTPKRRARVLSHGAAQPTDDRLGSARIEAQPDEEPLLCERGALHRPRRAPDGRIAAVTPHVD